MKLHMALIKVCVAVSLALWTDYFGSQEWGVKLLQPYVQKAEQPHVHRVRLTCLRDSPTRYLQFIYFPVIWRRHLLEVQGLSIILFPTVPPGIKDYMYVFSPWWWGQRCWVRQAPWGTRADLGDLSFPAPERLAWFRDPWGPVYEVTFLISLWSGSSWHIWKDKEWFVLHMCFHLFLKSRAKTLSENTMKSSGQTSFKQSQRVYLR